MFNTLSFERFSELAKINHRITVYQEIPGDSLTPINAYLALQKQYDDVTLLESSPKETDLGRFSYLSFESYTQIRAIGHDIHITTNGGSERVTDDPFTILRNYQKLLTSQSDHPLSGFAGGLVGFMSYDAIRLIENIPDKHKDAKELPDLFFRYYQSNITFDHQTGKVVVTTVVECGNNLKKTYQRAIEKLNHISKTVLAFSDGSTYSNINSPSINKIEVTTSLTDDQYHEIVNKAKQYIIAGDIFQVVPSRKFSVNCPSEPFSVYRALRYASPSPYMFYLEIDDYAIAGASPEKLVSVKDNIIESCPLAGTRPRLDPSQDENIALELLSDEKEMAEHMMLVDLARNDVGAIAQPGTIAVSKNAQVVTFTRVMHISSTINGVLQHDKDALDALQATFPAGTLSGAPKIRAMEIIDELENAPRGIYGGAICAIDSNGNLDSCIAIRTTVIHNGLATVQAGGGVVYDSDPQKEADETRHKARSILEGIQLAQEIQL